MIKKMHIPDAFFTSATIKSLLLSVLVGAGGWTAHTLLESNGNAQVLAAHGKQLDALTAGQAKTDDALDGLAVTVARIDGKLDVVNQKIDDDRRLHHGTR